MSAPTNRPPRLLRPGAMAGDADHLVIADDSVPVAVVVDPNGVVERVLTWPVRSDRREFEVASAVAIRGAEVWVGSPAAGGVVWFPSWKGDPVVIDLPIDVRILEPEAASGRIWVAGAPGGAQDRAADAGVPMSRRVEWRYEPSRFDSDQQWIVVSAHGGVLGNLEAARAAGIDVDAIAARVAAGVEDEVDDEEAGWEDDGDVAWENAPLLLWAIDGAVPSPVDLGGGVGDLVVAGERLVVSLRRPSDPVVMLRRPGEPPEQSEPGVLVEIRDDGAVRSVADLEDIWGSLFADADGSVWMLGFDRASEAVQRLDPTSGAVTSAADRIERSGICAAIAEGWLIDTELAAEAVSGRQLVHHPRLQRLADPDRNVVDSVRVEPTVRVVGRTAWFPGDQQGTLVAIEVPTGVARTVTVLVDVREALPAPTPPLGVDLPAFERSSVANTAAAIGFRHDWDRLTITAATLEGSFPDSAVVVRFTVDGQDGSYARRLALYDELGNTAQMENLLGQLHEDANTGWIPPVADCTRDHDGTAWC